MKVEVIKRYIDAETRKTMEVGSVPEYAPERANQLILKGFIEQVKEEDTPKGRKPLESKNKPKQTVKNR